MLSSVIRVGYEGRNFKEKIMHFMYFFLQCWQPIYLHESLKKTFHCLNNIRMNQLCGYISLKYICCVTVGSAFYLDVVYKYNIRIHLLYNSRKYILICLVEVPSEYIYHVTRVSLYIKCGITASQ